MELELKSTAVVLLGQIIDVAVIVDVVDLYLESLTLLKVILDLHLGDPLRREVVMDDFCLTKLAPHIALLLVENQEWVRE